MAYKIAIIVGSLRKDSLNRKVARSICGLRGDNLDCSMIEIGDLPLYNQDYDANAPEQYVRFRKQIAESDGVLFCSPEYNRASPASSRTRSTSVRGPTGRACSIRSPRPLSPPHPGASGVSARTTRSGRPACSSTCP